MIYAMRESETGFYKFGMARTETLARRNRLPAIVKDRSKKLGRPCTIALVHWVDWPHTAEFHIHRFLYASWQGSEWFAKSPETTSVLEWMALGKMGYFHFNRAFRSIESTLPNKASISALVRPEGMI